VVSTGGVSVGEEDHVPRLLRQAGGEIAVLKVAMKPGKPVALGRLGGAVYIGLPGNPVSSFVTWVVLGAPMAEALAGITGPAPRRQIVRATARSPAVPVAANSVPHG
jgi:molybdopterin molybdotransferase